ncbi:MAG: PAS domain S-box protein [Ignavibacteriaceae bacterium]
MNLAFDLFLLMFNLAQLHDKGKIIELFTGGMGEAFKPVEFRYSKERLKNEPGYEIRTGDHFFGSIEIRNPEDSPTEYPLLIQNAVMMLGIILERLELSERLEEERNYYKQAADQRFEELEKNITELNQAKAASLNLINDLTEEIESRARIEKQLSDSENQILLLLNSTAEAIYGLDNEGNCTFCNNSCLRILGYSEGSELIGRNMHNMIHHTKKDNSPLPVEECQIYKSFKSGEAIHEDSEVLWKKDGTSFFAECWSHPIKHEGEIVGSVVTFLDITERKEAEKAQKENQIREQKYASLLSQLIRKEKLFAGNLSESLKNITEIAAKMLEVERVSIWLYNEDYSQITCQDIYNFSSSTHTEGEILYSSNFPEYTASHKLGEVIAAYNVKEDERTKRLPEHYINSNNIKSLMDAPVWIQGKLAGTLCFEHVSENHKWAAEEKQIATTLSSFIALALETDQRQKAEENLRETKDYLESLIRNANAPIIVWDNSLKITKFNLAFEKLTGRKKEEVIGKGIEILYPEGERRKLLELIKNASQGMQWETVEIEILQTDGDNRVVLWNSANIYDSKKENIIATIAQGNDITERKAAEEKLRDLNTRLHILVEAVKSLSEARNLETIEKIITRYAKELSNADASTIVLRDGEYCHYAEEESIEPLWKNNKFPINECISGWAMEKKEVVVIKDIYKDARVPIKHYENTFVKSLTLVPVRTPEAIAAIGCYWKTNYEPTGIEMQLLQTLADSAGRPIENVRLYNDLEKKVEEKTIELRERLKELERFHDATINRELRIKELRDEIDELKRRL